MTTKILPQEEVWKPIPGYVGLYEASNLGRIKRVERTVNNRVWPELIMSQRYDKDGYLRVSLRKNGTRKTVRSHILIASAFIPNPKNKPEVNHKRNIKDDNRATEIEWMTRSENHIHAYQNGHHALCLHRDPVTGRNGYTES